MFGSICPCGVEGFAWLDKREIFVLSDSACIYEHAGHRTRDPDAMDVGALDCIEDEESEAEIDAFTKGKARAKPPNRYKKLLSCFNCGKPGHMAKECKIPLTRCSKCNWSRGGHKPICSKGSKI